jgi:hypothetical protein
MPPHSYTRVSGAGIHEGVFFVAESAKHFRRVPAPWAGTFKDPQAQNGEDGFADRRGTALDRNVELLMANPY